MGIGRRHLLGLVTDRSSLILWLFCPSFKSKVYLAKESLDAAARESNRSMAAGGHRADAAGDRGAKIKQVVVRCARTRPSLFPKMSCAPRCVGRAALARQLHATLRFRFAANKDARFQVPLPHNPQ
jgi:hypothetical protein